MAFHSGCQLVDFLIVPYRPKNWVQKAVSKPYRVINDDIRISDGTFHKPAGIDYDWRDKHTGFPSLLAKDPAYPTCR